MKNGHINLFVLPSRNKNNKYIDLMIDSVSEDDRVTVHYPKKDTLLGVFLYILKNKLNNKKRDSDFGSKIVTHVHWSTVLYGSRYFLKSLSLIFLNVILLIVLKMVFKVGVVWTVHNNYAHDYKHRLVDNLGRAILRFFSDAIVVQESVTETLFQKKYKNKNIVYIPHGNYIDAYGPALEYSESKRESLGISENDIVLLSMGAIASYKLNERIIEAVKMARKKNARIFLLIAGKGKPDYVKKLEDLVGGDARIKISNSFVPDDEIPALLSIADYSVFFYDESEMTSGGIILSLSYGVPVISRSIPASEIVGQENGFVYDDFGGLVAILEKISKASAGYDRRVIIQNISKDSWSESAKKLVNIYEKVLSSPSIPPEEIH